MSRIGKLPISLPEGVSVEVSKTNVVTVKGAKGELSQRFNSDITISQEDGVISVARPTDQRRHRALHGLTRALVQNMVTGVSEGYKKTLEVIGVGYRADVRNGVLELALGYSHPIFFLPPEGVTITTQSERGKSPFVTVEGTDKQLVGQTAAKIRELRPPEPYKGKGIRYTDEYVRRKAGKTAAR